MQTEQAEAKLSFFDLVAPGDANARLQAWVGEVFNVINDEPGVTCQRLALHLSPPQTDQSELCIEIPAGTLASKDAETARHEAFRLKRIAVAGALPDDEHATTRPTAIAVPIGPIDTQNGSVPTRGVRGRARSLLA